MASPFDLIFGLSAISFNLLVAGVLIAWRQGKQVLARRLGMWIVVLGIPFGAVLYHSLAAGSNQYVRIALAVVLGYILTELLLDFVLKHDFRAKWLTHLPYIVLEYAAFIGLIYVGFTVSDFLGWAISATFWAALAALIYYLSGRKQNKQKSRKKR